MSESQRSFQCINYIVNKNKIMKNQYFFKWQIKVEKAFSIINNKTFPKKIKKFFLIHGQSFII